jgi:hypothetical protein
MPMRARFAWKRTLLAAAIFSGAVVSVSRSYESHLVEPLMLSGTFKGRTVMVTATARSAGAIESLQWGGVEFLDSNDHGRDLQSAISFDDLGECDNPTEAGSSKDGNRPQTTSSRMHRGVVVENVLATSSQMAYWVRKGHRSVQCGKPLNDGDASPVSSTRLSKTVRFLPGYDNVLEHRIRFDLARSRALATIEVLTAYMPDHFDTFYRYDAASDQLEPLSDGPGEQEQPVVLAMHDGSHALGLYTPQTGAEKLMGPGYGRFRLSYAGVTKSNVVFRQKDAAAGPHRFLVYSVFGTLQDVRASLSRLQKSRPDVAQALPLWLEETALAEN